MSRIRWTMVVGVTLLCLGAQGDEPPAGTPPRPIYLPAPNATETKIAATFSQHTDVNFADTSLSDAMDFLRDYHQVNIVIDQSALQDVGIDPSTPISLELSGITLRSALRLMLEPLALTTSIESEVLIVTTREKAQRRVVTRVYLVSDLAESVDDLDALQEAIRTATDGPWNVDGEPGSMSIVPRSRSIVIRHNAAVHDDIVNLLTNLREAQSQAEPTPAAVLKPNSLPTY
jgi:hypothetical protein